MSEIYNIFQTIYYDNKCEIYKQVLCINKEPKGNLKKYTKKVNFSNLSPFQSNNRDNCFNYCSYIILSFNNCEDFLKYL